MTKAYKYFDSRFKTKILNEGVFRIGTLYDYRKTEEHGSEVGNSLEGALKAHSSVLSWSSSDPNLRSEHAATFVKGNAVVFGPDSSISLGPGGSISFGPSGVSFQNLGLQNQMQVENLYVFSMSLQPSREMMKKMGYDACYEISDVELFLKALPAPANANLLGYGAISYRQKSVHFNEAKQLNPALIKEPQFAYQAEARGLWRSAVHPIEAAFVTAPKAAALCKVVDL